MANITGSAARGIRLLAEREREKTGAKPRAVQAMEEAQGRAEQEARRRQAQQQEQEAARLNAAWNAAGETAAKEPALPQALGGGEIGNGGSRLDQLRETQQRLQGRMDELLRSKTTYLGPTDRSYSVWAEQADTEENRLRQMVERELDAVNKEIAALEYAGKVEQKNYQDTFAGQSGANVTATRISLDANQAAHNYLMNPTQANWNYLKSLEQAEKDFWEKNAAALDQEGQVLPWISQTGAGYLPQAWDQTKAKVAGGAAGAFIAGPTGAKIGAVVASGIQSFRQMQGAAFRELLALGMDEETARKAATDEAVISALIEMGDTAFDMATLGTGKALTALLGKETVEQVGKSVAVQGAKNLAKVIGKYADKLPAGVRAVLGYGLNVGGEYLEEGAQQAVSIANRERKTGGVFDLAGKAVTTVKDAFTGKNDAAREEITAAGEEGAKISAMFGGATVLGNAAVGHVLGGNSAQQTAGNTPAQPATESSPVAPETAQKNAFPTSVPERGDPIETLTRYNREKAAAEAQQNEKPAAEMQREDAANGAEVGLNEDNSVVPEPVERKAPGFYGQLKDRRLTTQLDRLGKAAGVSIELAKSENGGEGWIIDGRAYLDKNGSPDAMLAVARHEITHRMQQQAPEAYNEFREYVRSVYESRGSLEWQLEGIRTVYEGKGQTLTDEKAMDELTADYAMDLFHNEDLIRQLAGENRTLAERIREAIHNLIQKIKTAFNGGKGAATETSPETRQLEEAARLWDKALEDTNRAYYQEGRNSQSGETRYSIKETADGKKYVDVDVDQHLFDGLSTKEMQSVAKAVIMERFKGKVIGNDYTAYVTKPSAEHYVYPANRRMDETQKQDKMRAATELDHLVEVSRFRENVPDDGRHPVATGGLDKLDTTFRVDGRMYDAEVTVLVTDRGRVFYDITKFKDATEREVDQTQKSAVETPSDVVEETPSNGEASSILSLPQEQLSVKGSRELQKQIDRIVAEGQKQGRSQEDIKADIHAAVETVYQGMLEDYGAIKPGEKPFREVQVPRRTADDKKVSQTVRTILEAQATPDTAIPDIEQLVATGDFSYDVYTDKRAVEDARGTIEKKGYSKAYADWSASVSKGEVSKANTALGWALYNGAANSGDINAALDILNKMVAHQRSAAQAVQATRILKKMSPEGQLYAAQRSVEDLKEELNAKYKDRAPDLKIDPELAERFLSATDQTERDETLKEIYRDIGKQMPSTFRDKWNAWRYLAMLGNPRTHVRNMVGNAVFMPVVGAKNALATSMEWAYGKAKGPGIERSKAWLMQSDGALVKAAMQDYEAAAASDQSGGKYSDMANANRWIEEGRTIFANPVVEKLRKANSAALEAEDVWFAKRHYARALAQDCKANGITAEDIADGKIPDKARAYAIREAKKGTYQDANVLSDFLGSVGKYRGSNPVAKMASTAIEGILPFRKTPANVLARGLEYSPLGLVKTLAADGSRLKNGEITTAEFFDGLAAGLTGSGIMALGAFLAAMGHVRGAGEGDEKEKGFDELQGHQMYALEIGGQSWTLDWMAPECMPFFVGVNLWEQAQQETDGLAWSDITGALSTVSDPLLEMSCLQSLSDVFDAVGYASSNEINPLVMALTSAATSYVTQALPSLFGQIERSSEGDRMTSYTSKAGFWDTDTQYLLGKASAKIPGWDYQQIPYIDAWGRTENSGSYLERSFNNMVNPAYTSTIEETDMERELERLYEATNASVFPSRAPKYFNVDKQRKDLTAEEYVTYATTRGQTARDIITNLTENSFYKKLEDADRAAVVGLAYELANAQAKMAVSDYKPDGWVAKAITTCKKHKIPQEVYLLCYLAQRGVEGLKDEDGDPIANSSGLLKMQAVNSIGGLTHAQRQAMFVDFGVGGKVILYDSSKVQEELQKMREK